MSADQGHLARELTETMVDMLASGAIRSPKSFQVLSISQVEEGMRMLQGGNNMGKIVFEISNEAPVSVSEQPTMV